MEDVEVEWNEKLQNIIDYVENHLQRDEEAINNDEIARLADCSYGFFQKVFSYMNNMSFADYIRYRKLTLAGYDLKSTDLRIVDISYKYGYDSPTSFTKAFSLFHGITPKQARDINSQLEVMPKMQILNKQKYSWRIEKKPDLNLVGISKKLFIKDGSLYDQIPKVWSDIQKDGSYTKLMNLDTCNNKGMFGFCSSYDEDTASITYSIMVISDKEVPASF